MASDSPADNDAPAVSPEWVEIPTSEFDAISQDLDVVMRGDGRDAHGNLTGITRYRCDRTGTIYESVFEEGETRVWKLHPAGS